MVFIIPTSTALAVLALLAASSNASPVPADAAPPTTIGLKKILVGTSMPINGTGQVDLTWLRLHEQRIAFKYDATLAALEDELGKPLDGFSSKEQRKVIGLAGTYAKRQSVELEDIGGGSYWQGPLSIGNPGQTFLMDFDTGSADFWVPSTSCTSCSGDTKYNPSNSSTAEDQGYPFRLSYGDGSATTGQVYKDTVTVGGLTVDGQAVGAAVDASSTSSVSFDGIVGMGFPSLSVQKQSPLFNSLLDQDKVKNGQFSFRLTTEGASELFLGGTDPSKYTGEITWVPVTQQAWWQVAATIPGVGERQAIIDTGTTVVYGPTSDVTTWYSQNYPEAVTLDSLGWTGYPGYWAVPCSGEAKASLEFGGRSFSIPTSVFTRLGWVGQKDGQDMCVGGVIGTDSLGLGSIWLIGDTFISATYATFDVSSARVGFATPA